MSANSTSNNGACGSCGLRTFQRNRYFDGKLLATRDMEDEQAFLCGKQHLHNSHAHGPGSVCGLKLVQHPNAACQHQFVYLQPGLAYDCCGREIVVPEDQLVDLRQEIELALRAAERFPLGPGDQPTLYVRLKYTEKGTEPVPALLDDCGCTDTNVECNRIEEGYRLFVTLEGPPDAAAEPLAARLEWQHTLTGGLPQAIVLDRDIQRLYVGEWDGTRSWLRMFDAGNHSPISRLEVSGRQITAAARSNLGDLIYVATAVGGGTGPSSRPRIAIVSQASLETDADSALLAELVPPHVSNVRRLAVSARDDALLVLLANGLILRWSADAIRAWLEALKADDTAPPPDPVQQNLADAVGGAALQPVDMSQTGDGRWLVVADGGAARLIVLNLAQFNPAEPVANRMKAFDLQSGDVPVAVEFSYDGGYLYLLCGDGGAHKLYRILLGDNLAQFVPDLADLPGASQFFRVLPLLPPPDPTAPPASTRPPQPVDLSVSPRDNWIYVSRRLFSDMTTPLDRGEVMVIPVAPFAQGSSSTTIEDSIAAEMRRHTTSTEGVTLFQDLAFLGQRLYVAGAGLTDEGETPQGSLSILYVDEAACDIFLQRSIDGCPACDSSQGVIIASLPGYRWDRRMVNEPNPEANLIDNLTHRQMSPSTQTLLQVVQCMLDKGISEGIPGPRGPAGGEGPAGPRGPGIQEVVVTTLAPGQPATATPEPIAGDPEGDLRLRLGIPRGDRGPRGPGIEQVAVEPLAPDSLPTAALQPIPGDPEGDQLLILGLPTTRLPLNRVVNASWHLDEVIGPDEFAERFAQPEEGRGLIVLFDLPVRIETLHRRSVMAYLSLRQHTNLGMLDCDCQLEMNVEPMGDIEVQDREVHWLIGDHTSTGDFLPLVLSGNPLNPNNDLVAPGVRLAFPEEWLPAWQSADAIREFMSQHDEKETLTLKFVLRGDWILSDTPLFEDSQQIIDALKNSDMDRVRDIFATNNAPLSAKALGWPIDPDREWVVDEGRGGRTFRVRVEDDGQAHVYASTALDGNHLWPGVPSMLTSVGHIGRESGNRTEGGDWVSTLHITLNPPD